MGSSGRLDRVLEDIIHDEEHFSPRRLHGNIRHRIFASPSILLAIQPGARGEKYMLRSYAGHAERC